MKRSSLDIGLSTGRGAGPGTRASRLRLLGLGLAFALAPLCSAPAQTGAAAPGSTEAQGSKETTGAPQAAQPEPGADIPVGMNLHALDAASRELPFVDAFQLCSDWTILGKGESLGEARARETRERREEGGGRRRPAHLDLAQGWPELESGRALAGEMFQQMDGHYPGGRYVCTWKGSARIEFERAARVVEREERRLAVEVAPDQGSVVVRISDLDPRDPLRDVHFWMPGFEDAKSPFHPTFVERLRPFQVIRFGNWARSASGDTGPWEARTTPASPTQTSRRGAALEHMIALANEVGADPWFVMPHLADDEYVQSFAALVKERLRPDLRVYVEYSNEVWNDLFPQARWAVEQAKERGLKPPEVVADEAARDFALWHAVFAGEEERVVRVASGHLHNSFFAATMLQRLGESVDALAIGAYFGVRADKDGLTAKSEPEEILAAAGKNLRGIVFERIGEHAELARKASERLGRRVPLIAYEGGQHLVAMRSLGRPEQPHALSFEATVKCQRRPEMYDLYRELLAGSAQRGVELFLFYDFAGRRMPGDTFGHLEWIDQPLEDAPKYRAAVAGAARARPSEEGADEDESER